MRSTTVSRRSFISSSSSLAAACLTSRLSAAVTPPPNILFILADDLGYADLSSYGRREYRTTHIDRLAEQGLRFTQAYSNSSVCSATRFALATGRYQYRLRGGLEEPIQTASESIGLPPSHPTLPSLLRKAGYATALVGKWHMGSLPNFGPLKSGYEEFFGNHAGAIDYFTHKSGSGMTASNDLYEGEVPIEKTGYYTDLLADRAVDFIDRKFREPFFLSLHFTAPHWPWQGRHDANSSAQLKSLFHLDGGSLEKYAEMMLALDETVGRVLAALKARGIDRNTIVVFTSDNGGERFSDTWPFTGQKTELLEGGIRVPAIVRWPAQLAPRVVEQVAITMDWMPTLLACASVNPDPGYPPDGDDLLPVLTGTQKPYPRTLYWRYKAHEQRAVRSGDLKYLRINGSEYLFDLRTDARERANLADKLPDKFRELRDAWIAWNAQMLPITDEVKSGSISSREQADRYFVPAPAPR